MNGMADTEDEEFFFDDDFPYIPDDELQRLEHDAIVLTQQEPVQPNVRSHRPASRDVSHPHAYLLDTRQRDGPNYSANGQRQQIQHLRQPQTDSSDNIILDEDGLPLVMEELPQARPRTFLDETTQREQWRLQRFAKPQAPYPPRSFVQPQARQANAQSISHQARNLNPVASRQIPSQHGATNTSMSRETEEDTLRVRINELMRERNDLTTQLQESKEEVVSRKGEISNLRAKQSNDEKQFNRQLTLIQKQQVEESEKHSAALQAVNAENLRIASKVHFLKQDLNEETRKVQAFQRQLKERPLAEKPGNINTTPKRNNALRDGFDDDDLMIMSPVRSGRKSKQATPTANRKRKQHAAAELNVRPLALRLSAASVPQNASENDKVSTKPDIGTVTIHKDHSAEQHLRLLKKITNFRPIGSQETLIERLFKLHFPSEMKKSFGTIVTGSIAQLEGQRLPGDLVQIFINLWSRALEEKFHACITLLTEVTSFILDQDPLCVDKEMLVMILPVLESTITINGTARFKLMQKEFLSNPLLSRPTIDTNINNTACLELLYTIACLSYDDPELIGLFWRSLSTDFVLMMLNGCQTIPDLALMLKILATSILPETFSNITEVTQQPVYETYTIDRVCYLLSQLAKPDANKPPYSPRELCHLRQESLNFLAQLTLGSSPNPFSPSTARNYGTTFIANHPNATARLVRCAYDELAVMYLMTSTQHLHAKLVNTAVRILHFVLLSPAGSQIPWQTKFSGIPGGTQKFRVAMARLAYAEGNDPGIDAGITEDTARMATELLEDVITPDEVEDVVKIFEGEESGVGRKGSAFGSTQR